MKTFAIVDGDLVMASGTYLAVSGPNKIKQDLYYALHEEYGGDPFHPLWGSILERFTGVPMTVAAQQSVSNEVTRVVTNYIAVQTDQANAHVVAGTKSTMGTADVVDEIENTSVEASNDGLQVNVTLRTVAGQSVSVGRTLGGNV